jgi:hypothetical protein
MRGPVPSEGQSGQSTKTRASLGPVYPSEGQTGQSRYQNEGQSTYARALPMRRPAYPGEGT